MILIINLIEQETGQPDYDRRLESMEDLLIRNGQERFMPLR